MRRSTIDSAASQSNAHDREILIYEEIRRSLAFFGEPEHQVVVDRDANIAPALPGLELVTPHATIIALGLPAHVALADVSKRTLIARDLCLEDISHETETGIERLVWSSVNTAKMIAIGGPAWTSIQLLPAAEHRFYETPPLPMAQADIEHPSVLVIDHEGTGARALSLVETLEAAALNVKHVAMSFQDPAVMRQSVWTDTAWIHVHVGEHTLETEQPRLIDSWYSGRLTVHLLGRRGSLRQDTSNPAIHDQEDGFVCSIPNEVVAVCRDLLDDPVLRHKILDVGRDSVAPYLKAWHTIGADLLS